MKPNRAQRRRNRYGKTTSVTLRWLPALAAMFGALVFLILSQGGRAIREADPLISQIDRLAANVGLGLSNISLTGYEMTSDSDIFTALQLDRTKSLFAFDAVSARQRIEALPWVARARIQQTFPHRLDIALEERKPFALWRKGGREVLIDRDGRELALVRSGAIRTLPIVSGHYAASGAARIIDLVRQWPELMTVLRQANFVDGRRWTLQLDDGRAIKLPEQNLQNALATLMRGNRNQRLFDRAFAIADFRIGGSVLLHTHGRPPAVTGSARGVRNHKAVRG